MSLDHLIPQARERALLSREERLVEVKKAVWLPYPRSALILDKMEELLTWPKKARMPNLLIVGTANNGKTSIIDEFMRRHPVNPCPTEESDHVPVIMVQTPPVPDEKAFYDEILANFATPILSSIKASDKRRQVVSLLKATRVKMIIIDDIHDIMAGDRRRHHAMLVVIKYIATRLRIPIVGAGIESALNAIQAEQQLSTRFHVEFLPRWENGPDFEQLLANFEAVLPLREASGLYGPQLSSYIHQMAEGVLGEVADLLAQAASATLRANREKITLNTLKDLAWVPPSVRRKAPRPPL